MCLGLSVLPCEVGIVTTAAHRVPLRGRSSFSNPFSAPPPGGEVAEYDGRSSDLEPGFESQLWDNRQMTIHPKT